MKYLMKISTRKVWIVPVMLMLLVSSQAYAGDKTFNFEVTITNITKGQILSPAVVASHKPGFEPLFTLGVPAGMELAVVAEDADLMPLVNSLEADPEVLEMGVLKGLEGPIMPGESASIILSAGRDFKANLISLVGMLVTTNDAFYGLNAAAVPPFYMKYGRAETYLVPAYDAGTEFNNESCKFIPGPPCGMPHVRDENDAEGYVYIHNGIHGTGDLDPAYFDWKNPVAKITIRLVK